MCSPSLAARGFAGASTVLCYSSSRPAVVRSFFSASPGAAAAAARREPVLLPSEPGSGA